MSEQTTRRHTISADLHHAVKSLPQEDRQDCERVNEALLPSSLSAGGSFRAIRRPVELRQECIL